MTTDEQRVDAALRSIADTVVPGPWADARVLARRAVTRHRRRRVGGAITSVAVAVAATLVAVAVSSPGSRATARLTVTAGSRGGAAVQLMSNVASSSGPTSAASEAAVASAEQDFGLRLLARLAVSRPGANTTVSPPSLAEVLAMLENGARGATQQGIASVLGTTSLDPLDQDRGWVGLLATLRRQSAADGVTLHAANSLWLQEGLQMQPTFMADLGRYFGTGVWQADFATKLNAAEAAINTWVAQHTDRKISRLFEPGQLDATTLMVLANAVYFDAAWQTPFDPARSRPGPFHPDAAAATTVTYMTGPSSHAAITPVYDLVREPYTGGHYEADVIMPKGASTGQLLGSLTAHKLGVMVSAAHQTAQIDLPRFTTANAFDLKDTLSAMGMAGAFTQGADFSAMTNAMVQLQSAVQRSYLKVTEKGTEAAAATGISTFYSATVGPKVPTIAFDHPFLFIIRNTTTGTILFASAINNPST